MSFHTDTYGVLEADVEEEVAEVEVGLHCGNTLENS